MSTTTKALITLLGGAILMVVLLLAYGFWLNQPGGELDQRAASKDCAKWKYAACKSLRLLHKKKLENPNFFDQFDNGSYADIADGLGCKEVAE